MTIIPEVATLLNAKGVSQTWVLNYIIVCQIPRLKTVNSVKIFKNEVKWILLENSLYAVQEFCSWKESWCWFYFW
jgi:hypothetical protein